jgi:hypothetical protein
VREGSTLRNSNPSPSYVPLSHLVSASFLHFIHPFFCILSPPHPSHLVTSHIYACPAISGTKFRNMLATARSPATMLPLSPHL